MNNSFFDIGNQINESSFIKVEDFLYADMCVESIRNCPEDYSS